MKQFKNCCFKLADVTANSKPLYQYNRQNKVDQDYPAKQAAVFNKQPRTPDKKPKSPFKRWFGLANAFANPKRFIFWLLDLPDFGFWTLGFELFSGISAHLP